MMNMVSTHIALSPVRGEDTLRLTLKPLFLVLEEGVDRIYTNTMDIKCLFHLRDGM